MISIYEWMNPPETKKESGFPNSNESSRSTWVWEPDYSVDEKAIGFSLCWVTLSGRISSLVGFLQSHIFVQPTNLSREYIYLPRCFFLSYRFLSLSFLSFAVSGKDGLKHMWCLTFMLKCFVVPSSGCPPSKDKPGNSRLLLRQKPVFWMLVQGRSQTKLFI